MTTAEHAELRPLTEDEIACLSGSGSGVTIVCSDGSVHCDLYTIPPAVFCYYA